MAKKEDIANEGVAPAHDPSDPTRPAQFDGAPEPIAGHFMPDDHVSGGKVAPPLVTREEQQRRADAAFAAAQFDGHGAARVDVRHSGKVIPAHARRILIEEELAKIVGHHEAVARLRELIGGL